ncbi:MAG TPA: M6 family metalloprotease domain-containing protein, partial [Candidatus Krumholzibacteria bacterium]|nr:M6 family metalloprotease domain-containing protein [Candidatus Krumholzibacteria bacterium]
MNRTGVFTALACGLVALASTASSMTSSRDGGAIRAAIEVLAKDPTAYQNRRAWVEKARRAKQARELETARGTLSGLSSLPSNLAVTGTLNVPVLLGYTNVSVPGSPITQAQLQTQFFGANPNGSISDYYTEVSYGQFTVSGTVYPWTDLAFGHGYYAGNSNGLVPNDAHTGELIKELLDARDGTINFAQFDNDGPDDVPNSGDDDGYVDVLCVVHSFRGAECGGLPDNIASHSWQYSAWPDENGEYHPYTTNDARSGGGFIQIDDYNITPAFNCAADAANPIGTLCHELGHGLGLPDLYGYHPQTKVPTGEKGAGDWSLMATGNWNTPSKPAHLDPWCKQELGWLVPTTIGWQPTPANIPSIETSATAYRLPFTDERFRRSTACAINGTYSLYCGLTEAEGIARGWDSPEPEGGYGSNWHQTIERDFAYSGSGSVTLQFTCSYHLELNYDYARAIIEVNGIETVLVTHTGIGGGTANAPLTAALAPLAGSGGTYTIKFRVTSDSSFDDADGGHKSACGAFVVDDVSVNGGGEAYANNFESNGGGWHQDPGENPVSEYWLVENRRRVGFDQGLHEQGLLIWHVDEEVLHAPYQVNTSVYSDVRGLVLEEADGDFDLNNGINSNTGEAEDVFPGPSLNTTFNSGTTPGSTDNTGRATQISVTGIGAPGATTSATLRAGDPAPTAASLSPNDIDNDQVAVVVDVTGTRIKHGATFRFVKSVATATPSGARDDADIVATSLEWIDATLLRGTVNVYSKASGLWDLVVTNPDGQEVTLPDAVTLNLIVATKLLSAAIDVVDEGVRLQYELIGREEGEVLRLYRSARPDGGWIAIADDLTSAHGDVYQFVDSRVEAGRTYYYLLESRV